MSTHLEVLPDREAIVAGRFYPGTADELKREIEEYFDKSSRLVSLDLKEEEGLAGLIVPHAGYIFSGTVAASAYHLLQKQPGKERIFILGASHHAFYQGASVYYSGHYITPFGKVAVDVETAEELLDHEEFFGYYPEAHRKEHCLEVQLPFLQHILPDDFKIIPILLGGHSADDPAKLAKILNKYFQDPENLFIVSTDLSHYPSYHDAIKTDKQTVDTYCRNLADDFETFMAKNPGKDIPNLSTRMCGWTAALTLLEITRDMKDIRYQPVLYQNSGDVPLYGDKSQVVGYQSIALINREVKQSDEFNFSQKEKKIMLELARDAIEESLNDEKKREKDEDGIFASLGANHGVFVSVYVNNELRGCIGRLTTEDPLYKTIKKMAVAAATRDHRFPSVEARELKKMKIEISVLSPLKAIKSPDEIIPARHGILVRKGFNSGTFLPQVAARNGWDAEEMLAECADRKAGLGRDGWRDAELFTYEALVFGDGEFGD